jgi:hypothetical protein
MASWRIREFVNCLGTVYPRIAKDSDVPSRASLPDPRQAVSTKVPMTRSDYMQSLSQPQPMHSGALRLDSAGQQQQQQQQEAVVHAAHLPQEQLHQQPAQTPHGSSKPLLSQQHQLQMRQQQRLLQQGRHPQDVPPAAPGQMVPMHLSSSSYTAHGAQSERHSNQMATMGGTWGALYSPSMHTSYQQPPSMYQAPDAVGLLPTDQTQQSQYGSPMLPHMSYGGYSHSP